MENEKPNFVNHVFNFETESKNEIVNIIQYCVIGVIFITLLSIFSILGINFNPITNKKIQKIVTVESFSPDNLSDSFCSDYLTDSNKLNNQCNKLTESNCNSTSCCIWLNGTSCVAGNASGPTFRTTKGKPIEVKSYSYQNTTF